MDTTEHISKKTLISAIFLVAGMCIGGGMLALPVVTGISGFFPSIIMMVFCWAAMTISALLLIEVSLWMHEGEFLISMTSRILGPFAKGVSWIAYLFICYASLVAYTAGCGAQFAHGLNTLFGFNFDKNMGSLLFLSLFGLVTYVGSQLIGKVNSILFVAMITAFIIMVGMGVPEVDPSLLTHRDWNTSLLAIPIFLTSFSFQTMVPSLTPYLKRNPKGLRRAIIGGTTLTFTVYLIWQWLMLGIVPVEGEKGLKAALQQGIPSIQFLHEHVKSAHIATIGEFFAFSALLTSFLGTVFGLFDFLSDGLRIPEKGWGKVCLTLLIMLPTLFFALYFEKAFYVALDTTGGFGDSILNGIIPVLMVWVGRYKLGLANENFLVPGGKPLLVLVGLFFLSTLLVAIFTQLGYLNSIY